MIGYMIPGIILGALLVVFGLAVAFTASDEFDWGERKWMARIALFSIAVGVISVVAWPVVIFCAVAYFFRWLIRTAFP